MAQDRFQLLADQRRVLVCAGAGGVGKTTVAAAVALTAARRGLSVLCLTIDPAKRLADALGLELTAGAEEERVSPERLRRAGVHEGRLHVAMLDPKRTFDDLVRKHASSAEVAERILQNRFYRHVSTSLAGTQSYMAMEKVLSVKQSLKYDLIVLDTPPTAEALDFLDAPTRLTEALDSPAMRWLVQAFEPSGGLSMRLLARGFAAVLRTMGRLTGRGFLESMAEFVAEVNELFGGFKERAAEVSRAFRTKEFGYVIVAAPNEPALAEARFFSERLRRLGMRADAFVLNRVHQPVTELPREEDVTDLLVRSKLSASSSAALVRALADEARRAETEVAATNDFVAALANEPAVQHPFRVPVMAGDVRGLMDLEQVSTALFGP